MVEWWFCLSLQWLWTSLQPRSTVPCAGAPGHSEVGIAPHCRWSTLPLTLNWRGGCAERTACCRLGRTNTYLKWNVLLFIFSSWVSQWSVGLNYFCLEEERNTAPDQSPKLKRRKWKHLHLPLACRAPAVWQAVHHGLPLWRFLRANQFPPLWSGGHSEFLPEKSFTRPSGAGEHFQASWPELFFKICPLFPSPPSLVWPQLLRHNVHQEKNV